MEYELDEEGFLYDDKRRFAGAHFYTEEVEEISSWGEETRQYFFKTLVHHSQPVKKWKEWYDKGGRY